MPPDLRQRWVRNFWLLEQLKGLKFTRAVMPPNAINTKMRLLTGVDAAQSVLIMGCWGGFQLRDGSWSNQLLIGRSLLSKNESIPKSELDSMCAGSNMAWVVRLALKEWVDKHIIFGDSVIALCWITSEKLRLSLFHRNRVLQVRRGTELEDLYHVRTDQNPADCGTRPSKVKLTDVGPNSKWEIGESWMTLDIADAINSGILKPALDLRVAKEDEKDFNDGLIFGDKDDIFSRGHPTQTAQVVTEARVQKIQERADFSDYLVLPTKFKFPSTVRIYGYVLNFITKARKGRKMLGELLREANLWFSVFSSIVTTTPNRDTMNSIKVLTSKNQDTDMVSETRVLAHFSIKKLVFANSQHQELILTDQDLHQALLYLYRKASLEVKNFTNKKTISKTTIEVDGILLSKGRLIDGLNFKDTGELGDINLGSLGVKVNLPVLERWSPLSYAIAQHIHWSVSQHKGIETTNRLSLENVSIIQGMTLYREIANECIRCHIKRKKLVEVPMGPVAQEQLMIAPPFYITMLDLFGPVSSYVPGYEKETRTRSSLDSKLYIMVAVCVTTKLVNLQAMEKKSTSAMADAFTRLSCEVGIPSMVHVDQDSGAIAAFQSAEMDFRDLQHKLWRQFGVSFTTCPVGGHNQHGLVEAVIKSIQETFSDCGLGKSRIHATGWQTFCKLAENAFNNLPLGYSYSRAQDNTELLKIITPNMLRVGRINSRALQGPIRLPVDKKELLQQVELTYRAWFKVFQEVVVPRLIHQPKWFKVERDLKEGDLIYFQKTESALDSAWTVGQVDQVIASRDGLIRRIIIKYFNPKEDFPRFSDRSARKVVKLWSMDEACLFDDLSELQRRVDRVEADGHPVGADVQPVGADGHPVDELQGHHGGGQRQGLQDAGHAAPLHGYQCYSDTSVTQELGIRGFSPPCTVLSGVHGCAADYSTGGPSYTTSDGIQVDLAAWSISCGLEPLVVQQLGAVDDVPDQLDLEVEQQPGNLDTLHNVMLSKGVYLD